MERKPSNAFITAREGFCHLAAKFLGRNHDLKDAPAPQGLVRKKAKPNLALVKK